MVDAPRLRALLSRLHARRAELERYANRDVDDYVSDLESIYASRYLLLTAIEDALSVASLSPPLR